MYQIHIMRFSRVSDAGHKLRSPGAPYLRCEDTDRFSFGKWPCCRWHLGVPCHWSEHKLYPRMRRAIKQKNDKTLTLTISQREMGRLPSPLGRRVGDEDKAHLPL